MILVYRNVDLVAPATWWVTAEQFEAQIASLQDRRFVYLADYKDPGTQVCVTFDGGFENVLRHAVPLLKEKGLPFEVFVIGDKIGGWNFEDSDQPLTRFMSMDALDAAVDSGGRLQWQGRSCVSLQGLEDGLMAWQLEVDKELRDRFGTPHFHWFAYPGGLHDESSLRAVTARFEGAVATSEGDPDNPWTRLRVTMDSFTQFGD